jgi:hypothetical protein
MSNNGLFAAVGMPVARSLIQDVDWYPRMTPCNQTAFA